MQESELRHYGVKGMKWGLRRNPSKAFVKASRKAKGYEESIGLRDKWINEASTEAAKRTVKLAKEQKRAKKGKANYKKIEQLTREKADFEYNVATWKYAKTYAKVGQDAWTREMSKAFSNVRASDLSPEALEAGRDYVYMLRKD